MSNYIQFAQLSTLELMLILTVNPTQSLLMTGVENLLTAKGNGLFEVSSITTSNITDLVQEIEQYKPNIVIVEDIHQFANPADLFAELLNMGNIRLVVVNLNNNKLDIYDKSNFTVSNPEHFIEALVNMAV